MNHVKLFLDKIYKCKKRFDKTFHSYWCGKSVVASKKAMLVLNIDKN